MKMTLLIRYQINASAAKFIGTIDLEKIIYDLSLRQSRFGHKNAGQLKSSEKRTETKAHAAIVSIFSYFEKHLI